MRLVIDMQGAQTDSRFRGIGRYTLSLTRAMVQSANAKDEILLVVNAQMPEGISNVRKAFEGLIPSSSIRVFDVPSDLTLNGWGNSAAEIIREDFIASLKPDVVLITSIFEGHNSKAITSIGRCNGSFSTAVILYDLIPLMDPDVYLNSPDVRQFYHKKIEFIRRAKLLLAISESSRNEGIQHLGFDVANTVNISASVGPEFLPMESKLDESTQLLQRLGINKKFVLYTPGGFDSRKNFSRLIESFSTLPEHVRSEHQLVIVSRLNEDCRREMIGWRDQHGLTSEELVLPGYVEDSDLIALYSLTTLFVFPSLHEGFGLPLLEAMACGAPVIGSNCTSVPEVIGFQEALFDPRSVSSIREKMLGALLDADFWRQLKVQGERQVKAFSWETSAAKAWIAINALHESAPDEKEQLSEGIHQVELIKSLTRLPHTIETTDELFRRTAECIVFNRPQRRKQLLLDVSELAKNDARSGIQRVVRSILCQCLVNQPEGFDVRAVRFDGMRYWYANELAHDLEASYPSTEDQVALFFQDDIYICLDLLMHLDQGFFDVHRTLSSKGVSLNYIVYDLLPISNPEWWPSHIGPMFFNWIEELSQISDRMLCISGSVGDELEIWIKEHPPERHQSGPKIDSFHLGADLDSSSPSMGMPVNAESKLSAMNAATTFLMVSTLEPRKGHAQTLAAFEQLWAEGHDLILVIVGKRGWQIDQLAQKLIHHPENGVRLHWIENASDEFLGKIYAASDCLLMASLGEGFGLPLIEAAQHKLPIISRDLPVLREISGEHAHYFSGLDGDHLAKSVKQWLTLYSSNQHPTSDGLPWLTWRESTQQLLRTIGISTQ
jgi:glycosyltransferase involved in cell wall biosynthesis